MKYDGIVVGGGPAGMFAANIAAKQGQNVLLIERNDRLGKKLLITGKGRCNVTNNCSPSEVLQNIPRNGRFLYSAMNACSPQMVMEYFETRGCPLKTERGNRVFPVSDRSADVLACLERELRNAGVKVIYERVTGLVVENNVIHGVCCGEHKYDADWVVLATGGKSYPATGSTGDGYRLAQNCGHTITSTEGSLVPLEVAGKFCQAMQGLSLRNVAVRLESSTGKLLYKDFGELLFTHFGVSGPTVLSASAHLKGETCRLLIDLKPALDEQKLNDRILRDLSTYQNRTMENAMTDLLPRSMIPVILEMSGIPLTLQANSLKKEQRRKLISILKAFPLDIIGKRPVEEAIITCGGVKVSEIDPKTMESKLINGLFFAGEIIDCDAYTGGFNLQIAWASAYAAAHGTKNIDKFHRV